MYLQRHQNEIKRLDPQAFAQLGVLALGSSRPVERPASAAGLKVSESPPVEGKLDARRLAEQIKRMSAKPLSKIQTQNLRLLTSYRDRESAVASILFLTRSGARFSADIDW